MGVQTWANEVDLDNASVQLVAVVASLDSTTELFFSVRAFVALQDPSEFPFSAAASPLSASHSMFLKTFFVSKVNQS